MFRPKPTKREFKTALGLILAGIIVIVAGFVLNPVIPRFAGYIVIAGILLILLGISERIVPAFGPALSATFFGLPKVCNS